jgi:hypothetical protein
LFGADDTRQADAGVRRQHPIRRKNLVALENGRSIVKQDGTWCAAPDRYLRFPFNAPSAPDWRVVGCGGLAVPASRGELTVLASSNYPGTGRT